MLFYENRHPPNISQTAILSPKLILQMTAFPVSGALKQKLFSLSYNNFQVLLCLDLLEWIDASCHNRQCKCYFWSLHWNSLSEALPRLPNNLLWYQQTSTFGARRHSEIANKLYADLVAKVIKIVLALLPHAAIVWIYFSMLHVLTRQRIIVFTSSVDLCHLIIQITSSHIVCIITTFIFLMRCSTLLLQILEDWAKYTGEL